MIMLGKGLIGGSIVGLLSLLKPLFGEMNLVPLMIFIKSSVIYSRNLSDDLLVQRRPRHETTGDDRLTYREAD